MSTKGSVRGDLFFAVSTFHRISLVAGIIGRERIITVISAICIATVITPTANGTTTPTFMPLFMADPATVYIALGNWFFCFRCCLLGRRRFRFRDRDFIIGLYQA
jgi:hypothetical protein